MKGRKEYDMDKRKYQAILFAPDGDFVTDHRSETKEEVIAKIADQGSRWYFYPIALVTTWKGSTNKNQRIVATDLTGDVVFDSFLLNCFGKSIRSVANMLKSNPEIAKEILTR